MSLDIRWIAGGVASCFHVAEVLSREQGLVDSGLAAAMAPSVARLQAALQGEDIAPKTFFSHLIPLAAGTASLHQLAEVVLIKILGRTAAPARFPKLRDLLGELKSAFQAVLPDCTAKLAARLPSHEGVWNAHGRGIVGAIANGTEPGVLVSEATVILLHPVLGGAGEAYLPYNVACQEAVDVEPAPELPEVVRLAWLVSTLNLDMPAYSEDIRAERRTEMAKLAMIPITLAAAETVGLARCNEPAIKQALEAWLRADPSDSGRAEERAALLAAWHSSYRSMRPSFATALKGLDELVRQAEVSPKD